MKLIALLGVGLLLVIFARSAMAQGDIPRLPPVEAAAKVKAGEAVLIDVREPAEWESGVAAPAYLLPLSDLRASRAKWQHVLDAAKADGKPLMLYCRSGNRSGQAAAVLAKEGFTVANIGGFSDWTAARLPTRTPDEPASND